MESECGRTEREAGEETGGPAAVLERGVPFGAVLHLAGCTAPFSVVPVCGIGAT